MSPPKQKSKTRFSSLDIQGMVTHLAPRLDNTRLTNIYTVNKSTYLFKFAKATEKFQLLIESGQRIHIVSNDIEKQGAPNNFTSKLKKHLKGKRFHSIKQLGVERLILLEFGYKAEHGTEIFYLVLEMYAKGNIVLCDQQWNIVTLTRHYKLGPEVRVIPKEVYPLDKLAQYKLEKYPICEQRLDETVELVEGNAKYNSLGNLVAKFLPFVHQVLAEQYLATNGWKPSKKASILKTPEKKEQFLKLMEQLKTQFAPKAPETKQTWYSYWSENVKGSKIFGKPTCFDFSTIRYDYLHESVTVREETHPSQMMESYFNQFQVEENLEEKHERVERVAMQKYERIKNDQETRLAAIQSECESLLLQAQLIEKWTAEVQGIISTVVEMIKCGLSNIVKASIAQGQKQGDELANMVEGVDIGKLQLTLSLEDDKRLGHKVKVDLRQNASKNAQLIYNQRKKLMEKEEKTRRATKEVLKNAHALAKKEIRNQKLKLGIRRTKKRKHLWFEKFYWFLSGGRYLVISARDAQQNELLVKRYANNNDVVLHAQIQGCAFTVIKDLEKQNLKMMRRAGIEKALSDEKRIKEMDLRTDEEMVPEYMIEKVESLQSDIPPFYVLLEAATATLGHSKAWVKKVAVEVYWVFGEQVSKTAPSGLSLPTGSFMIYGKKNFVPVRKMEMGFGLMFKVEGEAGRREVDKGEKKKREWVMDNLFGEAEEEGDNRRMVRKYGAEEEKTALFWKVLEMYKNDVRKEAEENEEMRVEEDIKEEKESVMESVYESESRTVAQSVYMEQGNPELIETKFSRKKKGMTKIKKKTKEERKKEKEDKAREEEKIKEEAVTNTKKKQKKRTKKNRKKMKKYLERYGDETKEETEIRMKLMGFKKNYIMEQKKEEFAWNKKDEQEEAPKEGELLVIDFSDKEDTESKKTENQAPNPEAPDPQQKQKTSKKIFVPKDIDSDSEDEKKDALPSNENPFRQYTGNPKDGDKISVVIPVCSAFMTLSRDKFKVKLLPGFMKRGKIWKMVEGLFMQQKGMSEEEKKSIKAMPDNEAVQQLIGGCKVQAPGLQKIVQKQKKAKKKKGKNKK